MYEVSPEKLQELNAMINTGGTLPGKVSDALAAVQTALAANDVAKANAALNVAIETNKLNTPAWSAVQGWHDSVKNSGGGTPPTPTESGEPVNPIPADSVTRNFGPLVAGDNVTSVAGGDGRFSFSTGSGNAVQVAWVNGVQVGGTDLTPVKAGDTIEWGITSPAYQANCTYSIN